VSAPDIPALTAEVERLTDELGNAVAEREMYRRRELEAREKAMEQSGKDARAIALLTADVTTLKECTRGAEDERDEARETLTVHSRS